MSMTVLRAMGVVCLAAAAYAQGPAAEFEVASIKVSKPGPASGGRMLNGRFLLENFTLRQLMLYAWDLERYQVSGGPGWTDAQGFDVNAKAEDQQSGTTDYKRMMRRLLEVRFQLKMHSEVRETTIYALVVGRNGTRIVESPPDGPGSISSGNGMLRGQKMTMETLTRVLSGTLGRKVLDETGLTGQYEVKLEWAPDLGPIPEEQRADLSAAVERRSIFSAVQEQLGLKLEPRKGKVQFFVIDGAEKPGEN